jgi:two-component system response regulator YesN
MIGIPFKSYLTELRLRKAKELLGDSGKAVSDVAFAVGYASEERFRSAFKKATGLSPRTWRETMEQDDPLTARPGAGKYRRLVGG